mmetsp:Transcript_58731/g.132920  ORF Transcript_58731/g.132920 Transcript_58731/m.132920 type:complete len:328 (+) Transcript_58731:41-1024(+)
MTPGPTFRPTLLPTSEPTPRPSTLWPTPGPAPSPSAAPTRSPSRLPTLSPTHLEEPTTNFPTTQPTSFYHTESWARKNGGWIFACIVVAMCLLYSVVGALRTAQHRKQEEGAGGGITQDRHVAQDAREARGELDDHETITINHHRALTREMWQTEIGDPRQRATIAERQNANPVESFGTVKALARALALSSQEDGGAGSPRWGMDPVCTICLNEMGSHDRVRFLNTCQHCYHADCIDEWLVQSEACPLCKTSVLKGPSPSRQPSEAPFQPQRVLTVPAESVTLISYDVSIEMRTLGPGPGIRNDADHGLGRFGPSGLDENHVAQAAD